MKKSIIVVLILLLVVVPFSTSANPFTKAFLKGLWDVTVGALGSTGGWILVNIFNDGDPEPAATVCTAKTVIWETDAGTTTYKSTTYTGNGGGNGGNSNQSFIFIPDDFSDMFSIPAGYTLEEEMVISTPPGDEIVSLNFSPNYELDAILAHRESWGKINPASFTVTRENLFRFARDPNTPPSDDVFSLPISIEDLEMTADQRIFSVSDFEFIVETEELGVIFTSEVSVRENLLPQISGDIPAENFLVGEAFVSLPSYTNEVEFTVPAEISTLNFKVTLITSGGGAITSVVQIPTLSVWGMVTMSLLLMLFGVWVFRRRDHMV